MPFPNLFFLQSDITLFPGDAIVNAANSRLQRGGGVDGAIHNAAGPGLQILCNQEIKKLGRNLQPGEAVITSSAGLKAKYVIHAVGPIWTGGEQGESSQLVQAYTNSLQLAKQHNLESIAFPNISTGIYGFPKDQAAILALGAVMKFFMESDSSLKKVAFVIFDEDNLRIYQNLIEKPEFKEVKQAEGY